MDEMALSRSCLPAAPLKIRKRGAQLIEKITVSGGGATGHAAAAIYADKGFRVTLCDGERFAGRFKQIEANGGILLRGKVHAIGRIETATTDIEKAVAGAQLIAVHVMSPRHEEIARKIAPYLQDGQHILIVPGNLGAFIFRRVFDELHMTKKVTLTEQEGNLCPCRLTQDAEVTVGLPLRPKKIASLPACDTPRVIEALKGVWDFVPVKNVFEAAIHADNVVMHLATTVLSATRIEAMRDNFILFQEGFTPASIRCAGKIREERLAIIEAMGFTEHSNPMDMFETIVNVKENPQLDVFRTLSGPDSVTHRYLREDASCGGAFALSVARRLGLEAPVLEAFLKIAGVLCGEDYIKDGRTLENLGFPPEMTLAEIYKRI